MKSSFHYVERLKKWKKWKQWSHDPAESDAGSVQVARWSYPCMDTIDVMLRYATRIVNRKRHICLFCGMIYCNDEEKRVCDAQSRRNMRHMR